MNATDCDALLPPIVDDIERVPFRIQVQERGGRGGMRTRLVRNVERTDKAAYTPEGKVRK